MAFDNNTPADEIILIVGGGPSGCEQALLLAKFGIRTVIVERLIDRSFAPKAHAMSPRTLEICRSMGLDFDKIRAPALSREDGESVFFLPRLDAPILGKVPYERQDDDALEITPTPLINIPQPDFEEVLLEAVANCPLTELRRGHTWKDAKETSDGVTSQISTADGSYSIDSTYVIAADGAGSPVRQNLGIGMTGDANVMACMSITFSADLRKEVADRPGVIYWLTDPECNSTLLCYDPEKLWCLICLMPYTELDTSKYTEEHCLELIRKAVGFEVDDLKFKFAIPWTMNSEIAETYRKSRFFLIGDAAHRFPPSGGLGLNTGMLEANNLAWKIAGVMKGWATDKLLDSYESESLPIATQNANQSLANARRLGALSELACPAEVWQSESAFAEWLNEGGRQKRINEAVEIQRQHFNSIGLQLGFSYSEEYSGDVEVFVPRADVGFRMPHAWLTKDGQKMSTLDLLDPTAFTIMSGPDNGDWAALCDEIGVPNRTVILNDEYDGAKAWLKSIELPDTGALIVRPDGHILARVSDSSAQSQAAVKAAFAAMLG